MSTSPWSINTTADPVTGYVNLNVHTDCPNGRAICRVIGNPTSTFSSNTGGDGSFGILGLGPGNLLLLGFTVETSCGSNHSFPGPFTTTSTTPPIGPYSFNGTDCIPDPNGEFATGLLCQQAHPGAHIIPPGQTPPITQPPTGGGVNQNPCGPQPTFPPNPLQWPQYIGDSVVWLACQMWNYLSPLWAGFMSQLWAALPSWLQDFIVNAQKVTMSIQHFAANPSSFLGRAVDGTLASASPSVWERLLSGLQAVGQKIYAALAASDYSKHPENDPIFGPIQKLASDIGTGIGTPSTPEGVQARIQGLDAEVSASFLSLATIQTLLDKIPTLNNTGSAAFALSWLEARGIFSIARGTIEPYLAHNINKSLDYHLNEYYGNTIPDLGTLINLLHKGLASQAEYDLSAPRVSGIGKALANTIAQGSLSLPSYDEFILYNRRHPDKVIDLATIANLTGLEWTRYPQVFQERQYQDLSMRYALNAAKYLDFTEAQIRRFLTLNGIDSRLDDALGMSMIDVAVKVIQKQVALYQESLSGTSIREKHFGYALLIQMTEQGIDVSAFQHADLVAEGWDTVHVTALEAYISAKVAAKAAKAKP